MVRFLPEFNEGSNAFQFQRGYMLLKDDHVLSLWVDLYDSRIVVKNRFLVHHFPLALIVGPRKALVCPGRKMATTLAIHAALSVFEKCNRPFTNLISAASIT